MILNAPNSTVGRTLLQLCKLLKLRAVAVLRSRKPAAAAAVEGGAAEGRFETVAEQLRGLGATLVLKDEGSIKVSLTGSEQDHSLVGRSAVVVLSLKTAYIADADTGHVTPPPPTHTHLDPVICTPLSRSPSIQLCLPHPLMKAAVRSCW